MEYDLGDYSVTNHGCCFIAPNATVIGRVTLGVDTSVWFNAVIRGDVDTITIGDRSNIQDGSVLHVDPGNPLTVGSEVTVGHMVMIHGCTIGNRSLIGIGSTLLNGAEIGAESIVGAHALVTEGKKFPPRSLIVGTPAKVVRELSDDELAALKKSADRYVKNGHRFASELRAVG